MSEAEEKLDLGIAGAEGSEVLSFDELVECLGETFTKLSDCRRGKNVQYSMKDIGLGAFSVFFTQCPSFLSHQQMMQEALGKNNASSLFQVQHIPTAAQIRFLLDEVNPTELFPIFSKVIDTLERTKGLDEFRQSILGGELLVAIDGTQYFSSQNISCSHCLRREHTNGILFLKTMSLTSLLLEELDGKLKMKITIL